MIDLLHFYRYISGVTYNLSQSCKYQYQPLTTNISQKIPSFEHLDNMEKMDLSHNQLASVGPGVFKGLSRLRQLYLNNNKLTVVQRGSLDMLPTLEVGVCLSVCLTTWTYLSLTVWFV